MRIERLGERDLEPALGLLQEAYAAERRHCPVLPPTLLGDPRLAEPALRVCMANGCVGAYLGGRLCAFMGLAATFPFKGVRAALVDELSHASATIPEKESVYQSLYQALGELLRAQGVRLHLIAHFAGDDPLKETLYWLGFGAFLAEELRGLGEIRDAREVEIQQLSDFRSVVELDIEHRQYARSAPMHLARETGRDAAERELLDYQRDGAALFVYDEGSRPSAYFLVGRCKGERECRLLGGTSSAQILSAYASPETRGRGIGRALLGRCIAWARAGGYERLAVEHETANLLGSAFWRRHFRPYLTFSMRYVEL